MSHLEHDDECNRKDNGDPYPVLIDRKYGRVGGVGRLELPCFAIKHLDS